MAVSGVNLDTATAGPWTTPYAGAGGFLTAATYGAPGALPGEYITTSTVGSAGADYCEFGIDAISYFDLNGLDVDQLWWVVAGFELSNEHAGTVECALFIDGKQICPTNGAWSVTSDGAGSGYSVVGLAKQSYRYSANPLRPYQLLRWTPDDLDRATLRMWVTDGAPRVGGVYVESFATVRPSVSVVVSSDGTPYLTLDSQFTDEEFGQTDPTSWEMVVVADGTVDATGTVAGDAAFDPTTVIDPQISTEGFGPIPGRVGPVDAGVTWHLYVRVEAGQSTHGANTTISPWAHDSTLAAGVLAAAPTLTVAGQSDAGEIRLTVDVDGPNLLTENASYGIGDVEQTSGGWALSWYKREIRQIGSVPFMLFTHEVPVVNGETYEMMVTPVAVSGSMSLTVLAALIGTDLQGERRVLGFSDGTTAGVGGAPIVETFEATDPSGTVDTVQMVLAPSSISDGERLYVTALGVFLGTGNKWTVGEAQWVGHRPAESLEVQRSTDGGTTWARIQPVLLGTDGADLVFADRFVQSGTTYHYRARIDRSEIRSDWSSAASGSVTYTGAWWVRSLEDPTLNVSLTPVGHRHNVVQPATVLEPIGQNRGVVVSSAPRGEQGRVVARATPTELTNLRAVLESGHELVLVDTFGRAWTFRPVGGVDVADSRVMGENRAPELVHDVSFVWRETGA